MHARIYFKMDHWTQKLSAVDKNTHTSIKTYLSLINNEYEGFEQAILFGSYALNKQRKESDIDIAIIFSEMTDDEKFDIQVQLMLLASKVDNRIEPHPLSTIDYASDSPFVREIKKNGVVLKM